MSGPWKWSDHIPSGGDGMDGYGYIECCCGWDSGDKLGWVEHIQAMLPPETIAVTSELIALPDGWPGDWRGAVMSVGPGHMRADVVARCTHRHRSGRTARECAAKALTAMERRSRRRTVSAGASEFAAAIEKLRTHGGRRMVELETGRCLCDVVSGDNAACQMHSRPTESEEEPVAREYEKLRTPEGEG